MNYYEITPLIVPADATTKIRIRPKFPQAAFPKLEDIKLYCYALSGKKTDGQYRCYDWENKDVQPLAPTLLPDGTMEFDCFFAGEGEQNIILKDLSKPEKFATSFRLYALLPDLLALRPYKGDFHIHTTGSDGRDAPEYSAARHRQIGYDFAAISDHRRYAPSIQARDFWAPHMRDYKLYPGEEVHAPDNDVHIINFAANCSVNGIFQQDEAKYRREVDAILADLPEKRSDFNMYPVAASQWCFEQIQKAGGLAVFCHPYWYLQQNAIHEALTDEILRRRKFDAFELIGGFNAEELHCNTLQVARYHQECVKGNHFPVVGLSDSHGSEEFEMHSATINHSRSVDRTLFGWFYTVVLAKENTDAAIIEAVKDFRSVAVSAPDGQRAEVYGEFRIVRYVTFLIHEYFPAHDRYCRETGDLMLDYLGGDESVKPLIPLLDQRVAEFREKCFC